MLTEAVCGLKSADSSNDTIKILVIHFSYNKNADDSTFFSKDILPLKELINSFNQFYHFLGLKANIRKCEIAGKVP